MVEEEQPSNIQELLSSGWDLYVYKGKLVCIKHSEDGVVEMRPINQEVIKE